MHNRRDGGHEECTTGGIEDLGMHDIRESDHEECMTGGLQEMRNF